MGYLHFAGWENSWRYEQKRVIMHTGSWNRLLVGIGMRIAFTGKQYRHSIGAGYEFINLL
jgi:hypothetical protein